ncbi:MAG: phosphate ABC transporter substrate-binding protein PstS family protein [Anaerolineae bacterium]|nr:phosphate ABC transporter substrate-binding protein PstS family protein [Anaerolineae bacterium]MDW8172051.1 phosphate ABC transporter substrate-binding protein PstS family protein [Anaerolineae bacterium]
MKIRLFGAIAALAIAVSAPMAQTQNIVEIAVGNEDFTTLVSLVQAAGLVDALAGEGPFTVFAPTNDAFAKLPQVAVDFLLANPDVLTQVLTYHVVPGKVMSSDLAEGEVTTLQGQTVDVSLSMGAKINDAMVVTADIEASNGVIHVIDTVILPAFDLPEVDPLAVSDNIIAAGSSTVFPLTERMADLFKQDGFGGTITVDSIGTGAGFERFCVNAETDISNASRPIRASEVDACRANGIEPVGFFVAIDALAIAVSRENTFVDNLTKEQLADIFSGKAAKWSDVNPSWPAENIRLFSPGSDSGTYDYFVEAIFNRDAAPIQNAPGIQFSEDDNVLVAGVEGSPFAIGYFGYAYYQADIDRMRAIPINGVEPNEQTGASGEYPLARPLLIYTAPSILAAKPQVAAFVNYYLTNANEQLGADPNQIGYIPTNKYVQRLNTVLFLASTSE